MGICLSRGYDGRLSGKPGCDGVRRRQTEFGEEMQMGKNTAAAARCGGGCRPVARAGRAVECRGT